MVKADGNICSKTYIVQGYTLLYTKYTENTLLRKDHSAGSEEEASHPPEALCFVLSHANIWTERKALPPTPLEPSSKVPAAVWKSPGFSERWEEWEIPAEKSHFKGVRLHKNPVYWKCVAGMDNTKLDFLKET